MKYQVVITDNDGVVIASTEFNLTLAQAKSYVNDYNRSAITSRAVVRFN